VAPIRWNDLAWLHHGDPGKGADLDPMLPACASQPPLPRSRVGAHVLAQEHCVGTDLQREPRRFLDDVACSDHETAASLAQLSAKVS